MLRIEVDVNKFGKELEDVVTSIMELTPNIDIIADAQGTGVTATLSIEERETTRIVLEIVKVAEDNGVKLPREFGILIKLYLYLTAIRSSWHHRWISDSDSD